MNAITWLSVYHCNALTLAFVWNPKYHHSFPTDVCFRVSESYQILSPLCPSIRQMLVYLNDFSVPGFFLSPLNPLLVYLITRECIKSTQRRYAQLHDILEWNTRIMCGFQPNQHHRCATDKTQPDTQHDVLCRLSFTFPSSSPSRVD